MESSYTDRFVKWVMVIIPLVTLVCLVGGGFYSFGKVEQHLHDLQVLEEKIEVQVDALDGQMEMLDEKLSEVKERTARMEGYLQRNPNGFSPGMNPMYSYGLGP